MRNKNIPIHKVKQIIIKVHVMSKYNEAKSYETLKVDKPYIIANFILDYSVKFSKELLKGFYFHK